MAVHGVKSAGAVMVPITGGSQIVLPQDGSGVPSQGTYHRVSAAISTVNEVSVYDGAGLNTRFKVARLIIDPSTTRNFIIKIYSGDDLYLEYLVNSVGNSGGYVDLIPHLPDGSIKDLKITVAGTASGFSGVYYLDMIGGLS